MNRFTSIVIILIGCIVASSSFADIYEWTDENGVKHYSNYAPPAGSKVLMKTKEEPYDEEADRARMEAERQERLETARLELARREVEVEFRETEAERRMAEADRLAQEAMREADYYRDEAGTSSRIIYRGGGFWCGDSLWNCRYPDFNRWYYRDITGRGYYDYRYKGNYNKLRRLTPYQRYLYVKKHYGSQKYTQKDYGYRYRKNTSRHHSGKYSTDKLNSFRTSNFGTNRIGSNRGSVSGRGRMSWGRVGIGMRR